MDEYDGRQIVGIDLHRRRSVFVRMTEAGEQLGVARIDNDPMALGSEIGNPLKPWRLLLADSFCLDA